MRPTLALDRKRAIILGVVCAGVILIILIAFWIAFIDWPVRDKTRGLSGVAPLSETVGSKAAKTATTIVRKSVPPLPKKETLQPPVAIEEKTIAMEDGGVKPAEPVELVKHEPSPEAKPVAETTPKIEPIYSVQVGAFRVEKNAMKFTAQLKERGYAAYIFVATDPKAKQWHTVRIGDFGNIDDALGAKKTFKIKEQRPAFVTLYNSLLSAQVSKKKS